MKDPTWMNVRMPRELLERVRAAAEADDRSVSSFVRQKLIERLRREHPELLPSGTTP